MAVAVVLVLSLSAARKDPAWNWLGSLAFLGALKDDARVEGRLRPEHGGQVHT